ncbi:MAG: amidohydrolase family protein, partial [Ornithinimicrobium sp.]
EALLAASAPWAGAWRPFARLGGPVPLPTLDGRPSLWQVRRSLRSRIGHRVEDVQGGPDALRQYSGVKLLPHMDGFPESQWLDAITEFDLPVLIHCGEHVPPASIEHSLIRRLRTPIVLGHLGSFPASMPHLLQAIELAERYPHVLLETSACWLAEFVALASRRVPEQLIFGSDAPLMHPTVAWNLVATSVDNDALCERIAHGTAEQVLGW